MKIFLDDIRDPFDAYLIWGNKKHLDQDWLVLRDANEFVSFFTNIINKNQIDSIEVISWDHDLADEHYSADMYKGKEVYDKNYELFTEKTGKWCLEWLIEKYMDNFPNKKLPLSIFHSQNPVGRINMQSLYESYNKTVL